MKRVDGTGKTWPRNMPWLALLLVSAVALVGAGAAHSAVTLVRVSSPVTAGARASLTVLAPSARSCSVAVFTTSRPSGASGLHPKAPVGGRVTWTWRVEPGATPGRRPIHVDCGSAGRLSTSFVVACGPGQVGSLVAGRRACRPAADLRVVAAATPDANRVGGTISYALAIVNAGRQTATRVVLVAEAPAELVSASSEAGPCTLSGPPARAVCALGTLPPGGRAEAAIVLRATAVGPIRLAARVVSQASESRPADNAVTATTRVTEPDLVRGWGVRALFGTGATRVVVEVDAISGPRGHDATGRFSTQYLTSAPEPALDVRGRVVCLAVSGNRAAVGGIVEESSNHATHPPGSGMLFGFTDNGTPGAGRDTTVTYFSAEPCGGLLDRGGPELPLLDGDFVVRDEQP